MCYSIFMPRNRVLYVLILLLGTAGTAAWSQSADQLYSGARQAFTDELWQTAASQFSRLLREYPDDPRADSAAYMEAVAWYNAGEYAQSAKYLAEFPKRYPESPWNQRVAYWEGLSLFEMKDWKGAIGAFKRQLTLPQEEAYWEQSMVYLGVCWENLGNWSEAEGIYETIVTQGRNYNLVARSIFRLGQIRLAGERYSESLEAFHKLAYEYFSSPMAADIDYWIAECYRRMGRDGEALDAYRNFLVGVYDSDYRTYALLEVAKLAARSGNAEEALAYLDLRDQEWSSGPDPGAGAALRIRAAAYLKTGQLRLAREAYTKILANPRNAGESQTASFNLAQSWLGTHEFSQAIPFLEGAASGPDKRIASDALFQAGTLLLLGGDVTGTERLKDFAKRFPEDPRREEALSLSVRAWKDHGEFHQARDLLGMLIRDYPLSLEAPDYLFLRGELNLETGRESDALADYGRITQFHEVSPRAVDAHSRIGYIYASRGEHARAAGHYMNAASLAGGIEGGEVGRQAVYSTAVAHRNAGDIQKAVKLFQAIVAADPAGTWGPESAFHLGESLYDLEDYSEARRAYETAARYGREEWAFEAAYGIGWTWFRETNWQAAETAFERAANLAKDADAEGRARYRVGLSRASAGDWEGALVHYDAALKQPWALWREEALYQKAWALLSLDRLDEATAASHQLEGEFPHSLLPPDLPFRMGENAMAAGDYAAAIEWYDRCRLRYPESGLAVRSELRAALAARQAGNYRDAADRYASWVLNRPGDPGAAAAVRSWGEALKALGDPDRAEAAKNRLSALGEDGEALSVPVVLAWSRIAGIPPESRTVLEKIAEDEDLTPADRSEALLLLAHRYRMDGLSGRSRQIYEVIIRDVPGRIGGEAQQGLARSYVDEGLVDEAAEAFLAVLYLYPEQKDLVSQSLGEAERLYREAGRDDEAHRIREQIEEEGF